MLVRHLETFGCGEMVVIHLDVVNLLEKCDTTLSQGTQPLIDDLMETALKFWLALRCL